MSVILRARLLVAAAVTVLSLLAGAGVASAATFTVNDANDAALANPAGTDCVSTDSGGCTLRAAVQAADNAGGASTITVPANTYTLAIPSAGTNDPATGDLDVDNNATITLTGAGSAATVINANGVDRAFAVASGAGLNIAGVTIENGAPNSSSSGAQDGGAIYSDGALAVGQDTSFVGNSSTFSAGQGGGAIYADSDPSSTLSVTGASFSQDGSFSGSAIYDKSAAPATVSGSSFTGTAGFNPYYFCFIFCGTENWGGAITGAGTGGMTIDHSSFATNTALYGGAVYWDADAPLSVTNSTFTGNGSTSGGAIYDAASSQATISNDRFIGNSSGDGGALVLASTDPAASTTLNQDEFDSNTASGGLAGALDWEAGALTATSSSFVGNTSAFFGGAMITNTNNTAPLSMVNDTLSGNSSQVGGGIAAESFGGCFPICLGSRKPQGAPAAAGVPASFINDTITRNSSASGAGGGIDNAAAYGSPASGPGVLNTIVAGNYQGDCSGGFQAGEDSGNNLDSDGSCFTGATGDHTANPQLAAAADNGGPVLTNAELAGSPAIDAGSNAGCPATDARGVTRPQGSACDIGAYESAAANLGLTKSGPASVTAGYPFTYTLTLNNNGPGYSTGTTVTDQLPAGETLYGVTSTQGTCTSAGSPAKVTCDLGLVDQGAPATVSLVVNDVKVGSVTNTGTATNEEGSSVSASATTNIASAAASGGQKPSATTGPANTLRLSSANVTGTIGVGGQNTAYFFQWGRGRSYGHATPVGHLSVNGGVAAHLAHLLAGTVYHYRVVAVNSAGSAYGADRTFKTRGHSYLGQLRLDSYRLHVRGGRVYARFTCHSSKPCLFRFTIVFHARAQKTTRYATLVFTSTQTGLRKIGAGRTVTESAAVNPAALRLLQTAAHHRLIGKLTARPRSNQRGIIALVSLNLG